jgi:hypothetical protein
MEKVAAEEKHICNLTRNNKIDTAVVARANQEMWDATNLGFAKEVCPTICADNIYRKWR